MKRAAARLLAASFRRAICALDLRAFHGLYAAASIGALAMLPMQKTLINHKAVYALAAFLHRPRA